MNTEEILRILRDVTGDARGVDADDVLLSHLHQLSATDKLEFWTVFGRALELLLAQYFGRRSSFLQDCIVHCPIT